MPQSPSTKPSIPRFNQLKWKMAGAGILVGLTSGLLVVLYRLGIERGSLRLSQRPRLLRG